LNWNGAGNCGIVANDGSLNSSVDIVNINITNVNNAPLLQSIGTLYAIEDILFVYDVNATDPDSGDVLTYSDNTNLFNINPDTGLISFTPTNSDVGSYVIMITVTDLAGASDSENFTLIVNNTNDAPTWNPVPSDQTINEDGVLSYTVHADDVDVGDVINYYVNDSSFNMNINSGLLTWSPVANWNGVRSILVIASDGIVNITQAININVLAVNDAPTLNIPNQVLTEDGSLNLNLNDYSSDVEGNPLTYYVGSENINQVNCNVAGNVLSVIPAANWNGIGSCTIIASDENANTSDSFNIIVTNVNDAPNLMPINDVVVNEGSLIQVVVNTNDPDLADVLTYSINDSRFSQIGNIFRWQTTGLDNGNYSFRITVVDTGGLNDYEDFNVVVLNTADSDNDNVSDANDTLIGDVNDVNTDITNLVVLINGSSNLTSYDGVQKVEFRDSSGAIFEFEFNFSSECKLNLSNIIINKVSLGGLGGVVIYGVPSECVMEPGKTAYLDDLSADNVVCIEDSSSIMSVNEISGGCSGSDETILLCDGNWHGDYRCTDLGNEYKVEGLEHSAVREFGCMEKWECNEWSKCEDNKQTRSCSDANKCGTGFNMPALMQSCVPPEARLQVDRIRWDEKVKAGENLELTVDLENNGDIDLGSVSVQVIIPELGIRERIGPFDIDKDKNEYKKISVYIPKNTKPGDYEVRISISNDKVRRIKHRVITVI
jgi:hypothetical protein